MVYGNSCLDTDFQPFYEGKLIPFKSFLFAGGEPHIKIQPGFDPTRPVRIAQRVNSFQDLGLLCLGVDALRRMNVRHIEAFIPYFPAARQDRVMVPGEPLSVRVYADLINALRLGRMTVFDPHSEVTPALLEHCDVQSNHDFIQQVLAQLPAAPRLISPDGGALKKIYKLSEYLGGQAVVECSISCDVKTGQLTGFKVYSDDLHGQACLIVDDICDGGGTFIGLAAALKTKNAGPLYLAVSHGIFSKGLDDLAACFTKIFTTNSIKTIAHPAVTQIALPL